MSDVIASGVLDGLLDPLSRCLDGESARRVAEFCVAAIVEERVAALAGHANESLLSDYERAEYEAFINASDFIAILKLKAQRNLELSGGGVMDAAAWNLVHHRPATGAQRLAHPEFPSPG